MPIGSAGLKRVASFLVKNPDRPTKHAFSLVISKGSVVDFAYPANNEKAAIVNAANEECLGGGGVDGAITASGGVNLANDRRALPSSDGVRCPTGLAKITGPNSYGDLNVPYVIHAVGPNYFDFDDRLEEGDRLVRSAYTESLALARQEKLEAVAFSLLSSGVYRGSRSVRAVLKVGMEAIRDFGGYEELKEVHMCAFSPHDVHDLMDAAAWLDLERTVE